MVAMNDGMTRDSKAVASIHAIAYGDCYQLLEFACLVLYNVPCTPDFPNLYFLVYLRWFTQLKGLYGATEGFINSDFK
jgi:hypothetical protein